MFRKTQEKILQLLKENGQMSGRQMVKNGVSRWVVYIALQVMEERELIDSRPVKDPRTDIPYRVYTLRRHGKAMAQ